MGYPTQKETLKCMCASFFTMLFVYALRSFSNNETGSRCAAETIVTSYEKRLIEECTTGDIILYCGKSCALSHFYQFTVVHGKCAYSSVEHAYQLFKAFFHKDIYSYTTRFTKLMAQYCPPNVTLATIWADRSFSPCFVDTIASCVLFFLMCVPASAELHMYRRYGTKIQSAWLWPRPKLWILQLSCIGALIFWPMIFCTFKIWSNDGSIYGYTLLSTLFYVYAWLICLILLIIERNYDLPATPGVGHSILLNIFWALALTADLMYFVNFNGKQWYFIVHNYKARILLILSVAKLLLTLTVFILGMYAPGMITLERRSQFTYRQMNEGAPNSRYGSTSEVESGASSSSLSPQQLTSSNSRYSSEFLKSIESLKRGDPSQDFRKFSSHLSRNLEKFSMDVARKPGNAGKNRYDNVLPYDYNRVVLKWKKNDYINASWIEAKLPRGAKNTRYIATQGPLESTVEDFWAMVYQEKISIIVMLTDLIESDMHKCCKYWPEGQDKDAAMQIGGLLISCLNVSTPNKQTVVREFSLIHIESHFEMSVVQLQFKEWPDHGVPKRPQVFLDFLTLVKQTISEMDEEQGLSLSVAILEKMKRGVLKKPPPILLHCSAGVGRTGVYILVDLMIKCIDSNIPLKPWDLVQKLRAQRKGMVQTEEQFIFSCETALKYFDNKRY